MERWYTNRCFVLASWKETNVDAVKMRRNYIMVESKCCQTKKGFYTNTPALKTRSFNKNYLLNFELLLTTFWNMPPKQAKAKKSNEIVSLILNDPVLTDHLHNFTIDYEDKNKTQTIPFEKRNTVPHRLHTKIKYLRHVIWEKSTHNDAYTDGIIPKLVQLTTGATKFDNMPKNRLEKLEDLDSCIKQFCIDGYLMIMPSAYSVSPTVHAEVYNTGKELEGHRILDVPFLNDVITDKAVVSVMNRLLGPNYYFDRDDSRMHLSHRGRKDQHWHRDDFKQYTRVNSFQPRLHHVMAMYYPQDTFEEMGPTAIRRGSHLCDNSSSYVPDRLVFSGQDKFFEEKMTCPAGSIVLMHYDLVHRRTANTLADRYMFKMMFKRTEEPSANHFDNVPEYSLVPEIDTFYRPEINEMGQETWKWLHNISAKGDMMLLNDAEW